MLASSSGTGEAGSTGPPREIVGGLLVVIALGLVSVVVAVLARRSWAAARTRPTRPTCADDSTPADGVSDRG